MTVVKLRTLLGIIPHVTLQDWSLCSRVLPSPAPSPSLDTYLPLMSEFSTMIHSLAHHRKPTFFVYILLLFAETLCRSSRRPSQPTRFFSSLMECWYIRLFCLPLCMTVWGICIFNGTICVCFQCVSSGILIGCGMQKIAALSNLVSYYFIGLPVGTALIFAAELNILGNDFIWLNCKLFVLDLCEMDLSSPSFSPLLPMDAHRSSELRIQLELSKSTELGRKKYSLLYIYWPTYKLFF